MSSVLGAAERRLASEGADAVRRLIAQRLGWLDLPRAMVSRVAELEAFAREVCRRGYQRVLLLGMGGSSLAADVFARVLGPRAGFPSLAVLDTTDPDAILEAESSGDLGTSFFVVSSKSGTTVETRALFEYFWARTGARGEQFAAITDPGTPLAHLAVERKLCRRFENPPDVGGRFSALSCFGMVPAALLGAALSEIVERAVRMSGACRSPRPPEANPGAMLGAALAEAWWSGRDKLTLLMPPAFRAFGAWVEQLVAESTGKDGKGLVPIVNEPLAAPERYGADRLFVAMQVGAERDRETERALDALEAAGHPVLRLDLPDALGLGAEFYRWEVATALAGAWMGLNPFDQPNVAESKANTDRVLGELARGQSPAAPPPLGLAGLAEAAGAWARGIRPGDYVAVLAYLAPGAAHDALLGAVRQAIRDALGVATTLGYGPRFLHSTGQLHKGGSAAGVFLQIETQAVRDLPVPGADYTFGRLKLAQALGDLIALERRGRRVLRVRVREAELPMVVETLVKVLQAGG